MEQVSKYIYEYFTNNSEFNKEMGKSLYPLFVGESKEFPCAVYNVGEAPGISSDASTYPCTLNLCYSPESYSEAIAFGDKMKLAVDQMENCDFVSTQVQFQDESRFIFVSINFNLIR